jgi:hypothetical protein
VAVGVLAGACGGDEPQAAASEVKPLGAETVPGELNGLAVQPEEIANLQEVKRPFVEAAGLYSLRAGEQLQATLQISRFTEEAETDKNEFRTSVVQQIGSSVPRIFRMGERTVYLTTGRRQSIAIWFEGRDLFVLATREEYDQPRTLLREALEIKL